MSDAKPRKILSELDDDYDDETVANSASYDADRQFINRKKRKSNHLIHLNQLNFSIFVYQTFSLKLIREKTSFCTTLDKKLVIDY